MVTHGVYLVVTLGAYLVVTHGGMPDGNSWGHTWW